MQSLKDLLDLKSLTRKTSKRPPTKLWDLCEQIAALTETKPNRWLRTVKNHPWAVERALIDFKEMTPKNPPALFNWLIKKYKSTP